MTTPTPTPTPTRKRRRSSGKEESWSIPLLEEWGLTPMQQRVLVVLASVAGVLVTVVGLIVVIEGLGGDRAPERAAAGAAVVTQPRPDTYQAWASSKVFAPLAQSTSDSKPVTLKELFPTKTLKEGKVTLRLAGTGLETDCAAAVWGQGLVDLLAGGGCTQAARGLYVSADGRYVAQYTLFNLRDAASADRLVAELTTLYRGGWVHPLQTGRATFPTGGHTESSGHAMGHYAALVWIGRADGADPGPRDDFVSLSLTVRGVEKAIFRRVVAVTDGSP
ncbi:hypothetical protein FHS43_004215 [Streptosporangium becharense]|uniref:Uncharacterized protein n=1 Tax=Streptosporangium becharense TaxID=1816182 RepID=A0A7W9ICZ3_9ACTN|nr:hypothetical protein [Streptosporangium becharense]MBB2912920.1 hypothetical protein [Streptosporangium becharense]MBB5818255.1 hypothetical protein [Streptosporangium becharense]